MNKKRFFAVNSALVLSLLMLAGCGSEPKQAQQPAPTKAAATAGASAKPADYPTRPIETIVAFNPGGGTDTAARTVLKYAEKYAGTSFPVVNKPGAGGAIGFTAIAKSPTDGYTIGMINPPSFVVYPIKMGDQVKYKLDDFVPIANLVSDPGAFLVRADSPFQTLEQVIEELKKNPGKLKIAFSGPGSTEALALRQLEEMKGAKFSKVPFEGTTPGMTALLGGHVDIQIANASEVYSQYKEKSIRVLAVGADSKIKMMPEVPTYKESGFDATQIAMRGLAGPKGMDPKQVEYLADVLKKTLEDPEFKQKAEELALPLDFMGPKEYSESLKKTEEEMKKEFEKSPW
ncbi:tripartite tricarboxylate transporter substrate binding protein [Brevibacillus choshinensis]|uniref:tripartite tricarboxylate transporter substrate binding protein n=1 Tax=Brevibacillus choshinensis TaxID=54911 RepID=UPI002E1B90C9|nr:tripartite tricarboxylate transporter substrate binding protein [Brevibacillus choshinensis]MED4782587.1 tripartite tricarboxylate transporter substrate binding protein [Brevibacillus choshinensis]